MTRPEEDRVSTRGGCDVRNYVRDHERNYEAHGREPGCELGREPSRELGRKLDRSGGPMLGAVDDNLEIGGPTSRLKRSDEAPPRGTPQIKKR